MTSNRDPWPLPAILAALAVCFGSAISSLCFQHVSNAAPEYFFAIAVAAPLSGLVTYPILIVISRKLAPSQLNLPLFWETLRWSVMIGACFAAHNLLVDYGRSGRAAGIPDVSTVAVLILLKLVVPVSLALESTLEDRRPTRWQVSGVIVIMVGVISSVLMYHESSSSDDSTPRRTQSHGWKILSLCLASIPLALGFYLVHCTRQRLPQVSGMELWAILCIPELFISIILCYFSQSSHLSDGLSCVLLGHNVGDNKCAEAASFYWLGLPFGFAFNLAIPVLIQYKGATSVPLFRALALPIASLLAMMNLDPVIGTPFSWDAVIGASLCTLGLLVFYGSDVRTIREQEGVEEGGYEPISPDDDAEGESV